MTDTTAAATTAPRIQRIVSRWNPNTVLFECELPYGLDSGLAMRHALERAVAARTVLRDAVLSDADLSDADLRGADLRGADLRGADLRGADLSDADLSGADLRGADLRGADLRGADLSDADLRDADLSGADLRGAVLRDAVLTPIKTDFFDVLLRATHEVAGLRDALVAGRVDGTTYEGSCACLVGTIANVRGSAYTALGNGIKPDSGRPIERFFMGIRRGDTPQTNGVSKIAVEWIDEFLQLLDIAKAPLAA